MAIPLIGSSGSAAGGNNIAALIQALIPTLIGTGTTTGTQSQSQGTAINPQVNDLLTQLFNGVQAGNSGYTKDAAIADSNNIINGLVKQAIDANMPSVLGGARASGVYNDTTTTLLNNDLQSRIAAQAAQLVQQNINNYAQITSNNNNTAANIGAQLAAGNKTQTTNNTTTQQTSPAIGGSARNNLMTGLLGTIGGTALKNLPWDKLYSGVSGALGSIGSAGSSAIDAGGMLNAGYGFDNGFGGIAPSFGANLNLGDVGSAAGFNGSTYDFGSALSNLGNNVSSGLGAIGNAASGAIDSVGQAGGDLISSIGGGLGDAWNWLGDTAGSVGDWFSSFFANGGVVPSRKEFVQMADKQRMANGGVVDRDRDGMANGGRAGNAAYSENTARRPVYDISQALWESLTGTPPTGGDTAIEAPGTNDQGGISQVSTGNPDVAALIQQTRDIILRNQQENAQAGQVANDIASAGNKVRSLNKALTSIDSILNPAADIAAATQIGGAGSALTGSNTAASIGVADPLGGISGGSGTLPTYTEAAGGKGSSPLLGAATGTAGDLAAASLGGAGAALSGAGAGSLAGTVGAADTLGAISGGTGFLPAYTGTAQGIFGGAGTGAAAGSTATTGAAGTAGAAGSGAEVGLGAAAPALGAISFPLVVKGLVDAIFGGVTERSQSDAESWSMLDKALRGGTAGTDWLNAGLGVFDQFFNPNLDQNKGLSQDAMYQNLINWLQGGGLAATGANTGNAGAQSVADIGAYIRDNPGVVDQANTAAHGIQDFWNDPNNPALGGGTRGLSLANGGEIPGKQQDPQGSKDNIPIMVSGGEYVVPKSVVDTLGAQFFDNLVNMYHQHIPGRAPTR